MEISDAGEARTPSAFKLSIAGEVMVTSPQLVLLAPLSGVPMALDNVPDPVFASRLIGDGLCIDPTSQVLCAPMAGVVSNLQHTGHALSITHDNGVQVLLHIGLDTVNLQGKGFIAQVEEGQRVEAGQPLIEFDADYLALHARSLLTLMLVISGEGFQALAHGKAHIQTGQPLLHVQVHAGKSDGATGHEDSPVLRSQAVLLPNPNGLHARPAGVLAQAAKGFAARVQLHRQHDSANAKSLVAIMALQTAYADSVYLSAAGPDAEAALRELSELLSQGCGEEVEHVVLAPDPDPVAHDGVSDVLRGVCASTGSAFGYVVQVAHSALEVDEHASEAQREHAALQHALACAADELQGLRDDASNPAQRDIFRAHQQLLQDPSLLEHAAELINAGKSAAFAWRNATEATSALFKGLGSPLLAERALDLEDVGLRVLKRILGVDDRALALPDQAILVAEQLTPSQTAGLDTRKVVGFVTVGGGATSHVAILARALGIPALCGVSPQVRALASGLPVLLDADAGQLHVQPDVGQVERLGAQRALREDRQQRDLQLASLAACTLDGHPVDITANIASRAEAEHAMTLGAHGVGLLRSEFLYLDRSRAPSHDEQVATYCEIACAVGTEHPLVVRTLDVGGDKPLAYVPMASELNPFLGMRGIRLCLERPQLLRDQLRAILACAGLTQLHILLPMVTHLSELRVARQMLQEEAQRLGLSALPKLGIMIEVPAAALMADLFAPEVDFFSIGTNDLTQYTLAMDRDHPRLARQADSLHPAVLRLIAHTVRAAHAHGKWVGVCGALASEPLAVPVLLGLGVDELSVSVPLIPAIKARVREVQFTACKALADKVLALESAEHVRATLQPQSLVLEH